MCARCAFACHRPRATVAWVPWISGALHRTAVWALELLCPCRLVAGGWACRGDPARRRFCRRKLCRRSVKRRSVRWRSCRALRAPLVGAASADHTHRQSGRQRACLHLRQHHRARAQQVSGGDSPATQASAQHSAWVRPSTHTAKVCWGAGARTLWLGRGKRKRSKRKLCGGLGVLKEVNSRCQCSAGAQIARQSKDGVGWGRPPPSDNASAVVERLALPSCAGVTGTHPGRCPGPVL